MQANLKKISIVEYLLDFFKSGSKTLTFRLHIDKNGIIRPILPCCPMCSESLSKNGSKEIDTKLTQAMGLEIRVGKVKCKNIHCPFSYTLSSKIVHQWFATFKTVVDNISVSLRVQGLSSGSISTHIRDLYNITVSTEYVRKRLKILLDDLPLPEPQEKPSGVFVHDEQFVKIKGVDLKRISTIDANNKNIYYDKLHSDRGEETQTEVANKVKQKVSHCYAAVMDGLVAAHNGFLKVFCYRFLIQFCLFHFAKNVRDAYKEEVGYGKGRSTYL